MQALAGRDRRRLPDAVDHDARLRPLHARERRRRHRHRLHGRRLDPRDRPRRAAATARARSPGMYLANKVQNIQGAADTLLELAGLEQEEIRPVAEAMERGGRLAAKEQVTDDDPRQVQADRRARRRTASPRSRSTATPAARTSCSSCGATTGTSRSASSASRSCRTSDDRPSDRSRAARRGRAGRGLDSELHGLGGGDGGAGWRGQCEELGLAVQWQQVEDGRANVLGDARRRGRRADADVQRPPRHVVLGARAVARAASRASSRRASSATGGSTGSGSRT